MAKRKKAAPPSTRCKSARTKSGRIRDAYLTPSERCHSSSKADLAYMGKDGVPGEHGRTVCKGAWMNMDTLKCKKYKRGPYMKAKKERGRWRKA